MFYLCEIQYDLLVSLIKAAQRTVRAASRGGWNYEKQKTIIPHKTPTSISHVAHDWKPYSKIPPNPTLPSKDPLCGYLFYGHSGNINDPTTEFQKTEFVGSNKSRRAAGQAERSC